MTDNRSMDEALIHLRAGRFATAEAICRQSLALTPARTDALHLLGLVELQRGNVEEAERHLRAACRGEPENGKYLGNLGTALWRLGRSDEALAAFEQAHALDPALSGPLFNIGVLHHHAGRLDAAASAYERVLALAPRHAGAHNNLGAILKDLGKAGEARAHFTSALEAEPSHLDALLNLAQQHEERGDVAPAMELLDRAAALAPGSSARLKRALVLPMVYRDVAEIVDCRDRFAANLEELVDDPPRIDDPLRQCARGPFFLPYQGMNDRALQERLATFYRRACPRLDFVAPHCRTHRGRGRRIRIGFISHHFRNHTIGKLNQGLIERLPRSEFEVIVFPIASANDQRAQTILSSADKVVRLGSTLDPAVQAIAEQQLDIAYYTDIGLEPMSYFLACARLAPVQCTAWGHPITSGLPNVDYFVSCAAAEIADAQSHYTERLVRLPRLPTYYQRPPAVTTGDRAEFGFEATMRAYVCAQTLFKVHPAMDVAFRQILDRDPAAHIVLIDMGNAAARQILEQRLHASMPAHAHRVRFVPRMSEDKFMRLLAAADAVLDTFPFSGGNSSFEAFAMDVPVITLPLDLMRGRVTAAQYMQMGLDRHIDRTIDGYVARAFGYATDCERRWQAAAEIRECNAALFEDAAAVQGFRDFFVEAVESRA